MHLERRFSHHATEHVVEVQRRQRGTLCQCREVDRLVAACGDRRQRSPYAIFVECQGLALHEAKLLSAPPPRLTAVAIFRAVAALNIRLFSSVYYRERRCAGCLEWPRRDRHRSATSCTMHLAACASFRKSTPTVGASRCAVTTPGRSRAPQTAPPAARATRASLAPRCSRS